MLICIPCLFHFILGNSTVLCDRNVVLLLVAGLRQHTADLLGLALAMVGFREQPEEEEVDLLYLQ